MIGGVSSSGWGEALIKVVMAKTVLDLIERLEGDAEKAAREGIAILQRKVQGFGGVIALAKDGSHGIAFNTPRMARGYMRSDMKTPVVDV
jgi:beta-aspartyl-peptidase (threonine type)